MKLATATMSSADDMSYQIASNAVWPVPVGYTGNIWGQLAAADGGTPTARVTQITST